MNKKKEPETPSEYFGEPPEIEALETMSAEKAKTRDK